MDLATISSRHSVRNYSPQKLNPADISFLKSEITQAITTEACVHFQLVCDDSDPFDGFLRSYGLFRNARNYIACVVDSFYDNYLIKAGYYAEQIVLRAHQRGLGTCIVSGAFDATRTKSQLRAGWKVPFIIIVGYPATKQSNSIMSRVAHLTMKKGRPSPASLLSETSVSYSEIESRFPQIALGLQAAATAPSALNKHNIRFTVAESNEGVTVTATGSDDSLNTLVDMGTAMCNWQEAAGGEWYFCDHPQWSPEIEF